MNLIIADAKGKALHSISDYDIDLQYGTVNDFHLTDVMGYVLEPHWQVFADGTPYGGIIDMRCPSKTEDGEEIGYRGRSMQGVLADKVILPPSGQTHLVLSGDAHDIMRTVLQLVGLDGFFRVPTEPSGIYVTSYRFYRFVNAYIGFRMMLSSVDARLALSCQDGGHELSAVRCDTYGSMESERVYFKLDQDTRPYNHLIGLGRGEGLERAVSHWYADAFGNVSQTQTLFGVDERAKAYQLTSEEASTLPGKTRNKLIELQGSSEALLSLPPGTSLDIGDKVVMSSAAYGITATAQVVDVTLKASNGMSEVEYEFGVPDFPEDEE